MAIDSDSGRSDATRASLIRRAKESDSQAWNELVDLYGPLIAHWCQRCGLSVHQTADSVQEVFASVARSLDRFEAIRENGAFRSWLWTITSNQVKDFYRRSKQLPSVAGGSTALFNLEQIPESLVPEEEPTSDEQMSELVARGLEQVRAEFEPRTWEVFHRSVVDQIATALVAKEFGLTTAAIRQIRSRVLRRLRQQLGDL